MTFLFCLLQVLSTAWALAGRLGYSLSVPVPAAAAATLASRPNTSMPPDGGREAEEEKRPPARQPSASVKSARASAKARLKAEGVAKRGVPKAEILEAPAPQQQPVRDG